MIKRITIFAVLAAVLLTAVAPPAAEAAVPTAIVHFSSNTAYEQSLESYLLNLFTTLARRQEDFLKTFELGKIEAAREDVNKLAFDTLRELKEGALGGVVVTDQNLAQSVLKGLGITVNPDIASVSHQCASGAYVNGQCVMVKREGRIITNPDYYLYEEPIQKARDYVNCYYNLLEWRQAVYGQATYSSLPNADPDNRSTESIRDSIIQLDLQKVNMLGGLARSERGLQTAPPVSWYRGGDVSSIDWSNIRNASEYNKLIDGDRCTIILRATTCTDAGSCFNASRMSDLVSSSGDPDVTFEEEMGFRTNSNPRAIGTQVQELVSPDFPDAVVNVSASPLWDWNLLAQSRNPVNTREGLQQKVEATATRIIAEAHENRKAQFVAGQGTRPETYLIGWQDRFASDQRLRGQYYFFDTENVIAPSFILLAKVQAAIQAQFDLAQQAYKYPPDKNVNVKPTTYTFSHPSSVTPIALPLDTSQATTTPKISKLPAPFEDFSSYLDLPTDLYRDPRSYVEQPGASNITAKTPQTNYLNRFFKEVQQLHERSFSEVLERWFIDEATFFNPGE